MTKKQTNIQPAPQKRARKAAPSSPTPASRRQGESIPPDERLRLQDAFIAAYGEKGTIHAACQKIGIDRSTYYAWMEKDEQFGFRVEQAKAVYVEILRNEIHRRAVEGWDEDVYQLAKHAGTVRKYSDTLLIFQTKAHIPEYRDKQQLDVTTGGQALGSMANGIGEALRDPEIAQSALALLERIAGRLGHASGPGVDRQ